MKFNIEILPEAELDIQAAAEWYEDKRPGLAARFTAEIYRTVDSLTTQALVHRLRIKKLHIRWVIPKRFPYKIVYSVDGQAVKVFAVVHAFRHARTWKKRL